MYSSPVASITLDPKNQGNKKRVKIRITYKRVSRYYVIRDNTLLTEMEFKNPNLKKTKIVLNDAEDCKTLAEEIISELGSRFSFESFKVRYKQLVFNQRAIKHTNDISAVYDEYFATHTLALSTKESYNTGKNWILKYKPDCVITDIDEQFIQGLKSFICKEYITAQKEKAKRENKNDTPGFQAREISKNTLGIYLRGLRAVCNFAVDNKLLESNPFKSISVQSIPRQKTALSTEELSIIYNYETDDRKLMFSRDFFVLSFLMCGANLGDIIALKNTNLRGRHLSFKRNKTKGTDITIEMDLTDEAIAIIKKYGRIQRTNTNSLIFPYYEGILGDEKKMENKKKRLLKIINKGLETICEQKGLEKIVLYHARHTYATFARDAGGLKTEQIQKMLGHTTSKTTEIYLSSLTQKVQEKNKTFLEDVLKEMKEIK